MANNIYWGEGAVNNTIGWGQGAYNNTISWGNIYKDSDSGETKIGSVGDVIAAFFKTRALSLSCTFEAESCLITTLNNFEI